MGNLVHQSTPDAAPKTEATTTTGGAAPSNTAVAGQAASARALPPTYRKIVEPILAGEPPPSPKQFEYEIYNARHDDGKAEISSTREALRTAGKGDLVTAFDSANALYMADLLPFSRIAEDLVDLRRGGDLAFNMRDIVINYSVVSVPGKRRLREHPKIKEWIDKNFTWYITGTRIHDDAAKLAGLTFLQIATQPDIGKPRVRACQSIVLLIQTGRLGIESAGSRAPATAGATTTTQASDASATTDQAGAPEATARQLADANALAEEITSALPPANAKGTRGKISEETLQALQAKIRNAPVEVRDILHANKAVMNQLAELGSGKQALAIMRSLDSVEGIFDECVRWRQQKEGGAYDEPKAREPYDLMRQFLLRRPGTGDEARAERNRLILHTRLNTEFIERLGDQRTRTLYRIVVRGTEELTAVDKVHEAAKTGNGAMAARALMELAASDPTALKALEMDQIFRNSIARLNSEVDVDGIPVRPFDLCLRLWGRNPASSRDPENLGGPVQEDHHGDGRPLNLEETKKLHDDLYQPHAKRLRSELTSTVWVSDSTINNIVNSFERARNAPWRLALIRRNKVPPGQVLQETYRSLYGSNLRNAINQGCSDDARRNAHRVLDIGTDEASRGTVEGQTVLSDERVGKRYDLDQAIGEVDYGGKAVSKHCQDEARRLKSEVDEWSDADLDDIRGVANRMRAMWTVAGPQIEELTLLKHVHWSELLQNAYRKEGGSLVKDLASECDSDEVDDAIRALELDARSVDDRAKAAAKDRDTPPVDEAAALRSSSEASFAAPAQGLFSTLVGLSRRSTEVDLRAAQTLRVAYKAVGEIAAPAPPATASADAGASAEKKGAPAGDRNVRTPAGYYRVKFGIDPDLHVARVARGLFVEKPREGDHTRSTIASIFGLTTDSLSAPITNPTDEAGALTISPEQRLRLRPGFDENTATQHAGAIWKLLHKGGEIHLISSVLYGPFNDEEQKLIRIAFRQLSGGLDFHFYLQQAVEMRKGRPAGGSIAFSKVRMEGTAEGEAAVKDIQLSQQSQQRGGRRGDILIDADESELMIALEVAAEGEIDNTDRLKASAMNGDTDLIFEHVEGLTLAERKKIVGDEAFMDLLERQTGGLDWDRVNAVLMGHADIVHRLEARTEWGTDEAGMRKDVKAYVTRRRRKHEADIRERTKGTDFAPDPAAMAAEVTAKVREDCAHLLSNDSVRGVIDDELSGYDKSELDGLLFGLGEENATAHVLRDGDWTDSESDIISSIKSMPRAERERLRNDPEYIRRLGDLCDTDEDYRDAMNALMSGTPGLSEGGGEDHLAALDVASRDERQIKGEMNYEETDVVSHLCSLSEAEFRQLLDNPQLRAQILAAVEGDSEEAQVVRLLAFRFPEVSQEAGVNNTSQAAPTDVGLTAADRNTLAFLQFQAVEKIKEGAGRSWDELLRASIEVYGLDFEGDGSGSREPEPDPAPDASSAASPTIAGGVGTTAPRADIEVSGAEAKKTMSRAELRREAGRAARMAVWRASGQAAQRQIRYKEDRRTMIRDAVLRVADPSTARLKENVGVLDDEDEIKESLRNASDEVLIKEWTSVLKTPARGGKRTMKAVWDEYKTLRDAQPRAELDDEEDKAAEEAAKEKPADVPSPEEQAAQMQAAGIVPAPKDKEMPEAATPLSSKLLAFMNYVVDLSSDFQKLLLPHAGSFLGGSNSSKEETLTSEIDNTEWHEWADIIRGRIPRLPDDKIAAALEIPATDVDYGVIGNPNRVALTKAEFRRQKYLRQAGSNYGKHRIAQAEHENMDIAMTRYGRAVGEGQTNEEGGWGVISKDEERRLEETYGEDVDAAIKGYKDAKAKIAMWAAIIVGVIVTAAITILTGGVAAGPGGMLLMAMITGGASAGASALTKEMIMQGDYGSDSAISEIATGAIMGAITVGSAYYAQNIFRGVAGLSTAAQAAKAVGSAQAPGIFTKLAMEAGEEILSEGLSFGAESMLVLLDPNTWEEGWTEGKRKAQAEIGEKLAAAPMNMLKATVAVMAMGAAQKIMPGRKNAMGGSVDLGAATDPRARAIGLLKDQPDALLEGGVTLLLDKAFEGDFNIDDLPADLLMAYLEESKEGAMMSGVADMHATTSRNWVKTNLDKHAEQMTAQERVDYAAIHQAALDDSSLSFTGGDEVGTSVRITAEQYIKFRQIAGIQAAQRWQAQTGETLSKGDVAAFVDFLRSSKDQAEFAARMKMDPRLATALHKIESDNTAIDQADADATGLKGDKSGDKTKSGAADDAGTASTKDAVTGYRTADQSEAAKARTDKALASLDSAALSDAQALIASAENAGQKSLIERAIAAGNSMSDVKALADSMKGYTTTFVLRNFSGMGIFQRYQQSCVPTAYQIARSDIDPVYAMRLHDNPQRVIDEQRGAVRGAGGATTPRRDVASGKDIPKNVKDGLVDSRVRKQLEDEQYKGDGDRGGIDMTDMVGTDMHEGFEKAAGTDYDVLTNDSLPFKNPGQGTFEDGTVPHDRIRAALAAGLPVIISSMNHAMVISGIVVEDGVEKYVVHDPMSASTSLLSPDMFDLLKTQSITIPSVDGKRAATDTKATATDVDIDAETDSDTRAGGVDPSKEATSPLSETEVALLTDIDNKVTELATENVSTDEASKQERAAAEAALSDLIKRLGLDKLSPEERARRLDKLSNRARNFVIVRSDINRRQEFRDESGDHSGLEVHNHFMGVVEPDVFASRVAKHEGKKAGNEGKGSAELTLDAIASLPGLDHSVDEDGKTRRGTSGDAMNLVREAQRQIRRERTTPETGTVDEARINEIAEEAVRKALVATEETDFNSSYEIRDELIKKYFGKTDKAADDKGKLEPDKSLVNDVERAAAADGARRTAGTDAADQQAAADKADAALPAYADYAREAIAVLVEEGQNYTEQSQSLNKLLRSFPRPLLQRLVDEAVAPKLEKINADLASGKITAEEAQSRRDAVRLVFRNLAMIPTGLFAPTDAKAKRAFEERSGKDDRRPELSAEENAALDAEDRALRKEMREREDGTTVEEPNDLREHGEEFVKQQEDSGLFEQLERGDTTGIDIAGLEEFKFTAAGRARFRAIYRKLAAVSAAKGDVVVLRPHVGEGSLDLADTSQAHGIGNAARQGERAGAAPTDELAHYDRARHNVDALIASLEELSAMGELDPSKVEVRFGHSTHATPSQIVRLQALGVIAEVNLASNIQTHSLDPTNPETGKVEEGRFDDHALLSLIYYQTKLILSTDAHSVMSTSLAQEYAKAHTLIEAFLFGQLPLRLRPDEAGGRGREVILGGGTGTVESVQELRVGDLTTDELNRFLNAYQSIMEFATDYRDQAVTRETKKDKTEGKSTESTKTGGGDVDAEAGKSATDLATINKTIRDRYAHELAPQEYVGPADGAPVLEHNPDDALIGLPTNAIGAEGSFDEATAALQESGIPRYQQLTPAERAHEEAFIKEVEADMPVAVEKSYAMAASSDYVFEVDAAKRLYSEYGQGGKAKTDAETQVRLTANHAMHPTAVAVTRLAFLKRLDELAGLEDGDPKKAVFVTNGGCAAGKGSLTGLVKQETGSFTFGAVWDAAGEGDAQENGWILAAAQSRGLNVTFGMVENDPIKQYKAVLGRAQSKGRIVDPVTFARSYVQGQKNMRAFLDSPEYKAAVAAGTAQTFGMFTGAFNVRSLTEEGQSPYPDMRLLGNKGEITSSDDLAEPADLHEAVNAALDLFDAWRAEEEAKGNDVSDYHTGGIVNALKFGASTDHSTTAKPATKTGSTKTGGGAAAKVQGSSFQGKARKGETRETLATDQLPAPLARAATMVEGADISGTSATLTVDGKTVNVTFELGAKETNDVATHDFDAEGQTEVRVIISPRAREQDLARAMVHELTELRALIEDPTLRDRKNALEKGSKPESAAELNHHDRGRVSELRMLVRDLEEATTDEARADIEAEIGHLMLALGFTWDGLGRGTKDRKRAAALFGDDLASGLNEAMTPELDVGLDLTELGKLTLDELKAKVKAMIEQVTEQVEASKLSSRNGPDLDKRRAGNNALKLENLRRDLDGLDLTSVPDAVGQLIALGREHNVRGLQSRGTIGVPGHQHDAFIHSVVTKLGEELSGGGAVSPGVSGVSLASVLDPARAAYAEALHKASQTGSAQFEVAGQALVVTHPDGYVFPASRMSAEDAEAKYKEFAYTGAQFKTMTIDDLANIARDIAKGTAVSEEMVTIFVAAMVAEAERNLAAEVTNRLALSGAGDRAFGEEGALPMAAGGTVKDPRDRSLDSSRKGSAFASGAVTDAEIQMAKDAFKEATGHDLAELLDNEGTTGATRAKIETALRSQMFDLL